MTAMTENPYVYYVLELTSGGWLRENHNDGFIAEAAHFPLINAFYYPVLFSFLQKITLLQ